MLEHMTNDECRSAHQMQFDEVSKSIDPKWMAVIWEVERDQVSIKKTTCNFPRENFAQTLFQLKEMLEAELKELGLAFVNERPGPLPTADHIRIVDSPNSLQRWWSWRSNISKGQRQET